MATITEELLNGYARFNKTPASIQQVTLNSLEGVLNGNDIVEPTNPFVFLLESASTMAAASIAKSESVARKIHPLLAVTEQDLYHHMSDKDYVGRFATPSRTTLKIYLPYNDLKNVAVIDTEAVPVNPNIRSVRFPRNSIIKVNGVEMGFTYPIRVDVLPSGSVQTFYETDEENPLRTLTSNIVPSKLVIFNNTHYLEMTVEVDQFSVASNFYTLDNTGAFKQKVPFNDQFLYVRAYTNDGSNVWEEINVTHSLMVYDPEDVTLQVEVGAGILMLKLPEIYQSTSMAGVAIRVDIYTTRGEMIMDLVEIASGNFTGSWDDLDTYASNLLTAPLDEINDIIIAGTGLLSGGSNGKTLEQLRKSVIYHTGQHPVPILPSDIIVDLEEMGYTTQRYIDNVTDRVFVASKPMPSFERNGLSSTIKANMQQVLFNSNWGLPAEDYTYTLVNNGNRTTVKPGAFYQWTEGAIKVLTDTAIDNIDALGNEPLTNLLNNGEYYYSPFYYVLDYTQSTFKARPYHLSQPVITGRTFEDSNSALAYSLGSKSIDVVLDGNNYVVTVVVSKPSNGLTAAIKTQLRYINSASSESGYINGVEVGSSQTETTFEFVIPTSFDIDQLNQIEFNGLYLNNETLGDILVPIESQWRLFIMVEGTTPPSDFDTLFSDDHLPNPVIGAAYETVTIRFGTLLEGLYVPARAVIGETIYAKYAADVPALYTEIVYQSDPDTGIAFEEDVNGDPQPIILHNIGDPVLDGLGDPVMAHLAGETIYGPDGEPVVDVPATIEYQVGITMLDGLYRFVTAENTVGYRESIPEAIVGYLQNEIIPMDDNLSERTDLYYKPKGTVGEIRVLLGGGITTTIPSTLDFTVNIYLTKVGYQNDDLRTKLVTKTRNVISEAIQKVTLSINDITDAIKQDSGAEVLAVDVEKFGVNKDIAIMSLEDEGGSYSVKENLVLLPNGTLDILDTIKVNFFKVGRE